MSRRMNPGEYEWEPIPGLPERLPEGEEILWQGAPVFRSLAIRAFHVRKVALYFGLLLAWSAVEAALGMVSVAEAAGPALRLAVLGSAAVGILAVVARLSSRTALYTVTNRRVVMRFGIALELAVNLPYEAIQSADLRLWRDRTGDLSLVTEGADQLGYVMLWPFARPWRFGARTTPMLRAIPEASRVADLLHEALVASAREGVPASEPPGVSAPRFAPVAAA